MKKFFTIISFPFWLLWKIITTGATLLSATALLCIVGMICASVLYQPLPQISDQTVFLLSPQGTIVEQRSNIDPLTRLINGLSGLPLEQDTFLQDIIDAIDAAAHDSRIQSMVLDTDRLERISLDQAQDIGRAMERFKQTGKTIFARGNAFSQGRYYLASWADDISLHPMGRVDIKGFGIFQIYLADFLDKIRIDCHIFRAGTYKSAVEPLIRNDMSAAAREAHQLWLQKLWLNYCGTIAKHRGVPTTNVTLFADNLTAKLQAAQGDHAVMALQNGLVDHLETDHQFIKRLTEHGALPSPVPEGYCSVTLDEYRQVMPHSYVVGPAVKDVIGIISVSGNILYGENIINQIGSEDLIAQIRQAAVNPTIKALVLRITTGGGSAFASERIRQELIAFQKTGRPVVVSMGAVTASGGYWLAANADAIYASPTTLTGSIGIFGVIPTIDRAIQSLGIHGDGVATTRNANFGNPVTPMSETEKRYFQLSVDNGYRRFLDIVAQGRDMSSETVKNIAQGRVWDGATAVEIGLVDKLGSLRDAVAEAARLAHIPEENGLYLAPRKRGLQGVLEQLSTTASKGILRLIGDTLPGVSMLHLQSNHDFPVFASDPNGIYAQAWLPDNVDGL
ncbi:MAG: signal peptide peptidase SppA [Desulfobulbus propionicus]|nr:MAG: signal peptide peptidase SppA [Desulfobulbus propionicus]